MRGEKEMKYIWYACYGSNINRSRFMDYIEGCTDTTPPVEDRPFEFDHPVFFAGKSLRWGGKGKAFLDGVLSGAVEPIGAVLTILAASLIVPAMPYLLSFAAGAMIYVVVEELIPEMSSGEHSNIGVLMFSLGFTLMMALDVALG